MTDTRFARWLEALDERHLATLRVQEVTRALRALSSVYVERRGAIGRGAALDSAGKRAAFALFYGPLHYLLTRHVVLGLDAARAEVDAVVDLGCGTGAAGAAWAVAIGEHRDAQRGSPVGTPAPIAVVGIDRHPWAVEETRWTYRAIGLEGRARCADLARTRLEGAGRAILLSFAANELADADRPPLLDRLVRATHRGSPVLVVEPVARSIGKWWEAWADAFRRAGGREDAWRFDVPLPDRVRQLDRAAGLDHRVLTGRSLYLPGGSEST